MSYAAACAQCAAINEAIHGEPLAQERYAALMEEPDDITPRTAGFGHDAHADNPLYDEPDEMIDIREMRD